MITTEKIFFAQTSKLIKINTKAPGRLKIGKNIEFKLLLKGYVTFLKL